MTKETVKLLCRELIVNRCLEFQEEKVNSQKNEVHSNSVSMHMVIVSFETTPQAAAKIRSGNCKGLQISAAYVTIEKYEKEIPSVLYLDTPIKIDETRDCCNITFE